MSDEENLSSDSDACKLSLDETRINELTSKLLNFKPKASNKGKGKTTRANSKSSTEDAQQQFYDALISEVRALHSKFDSFLGKINKLEEGIVANKREIDTLKAEGKSKDEKISQLEYAIDNVEQAARSRQVLVSGLNLQVGGNVAENVKETIASVAKIPICKLENATIQPFGRSEEKVLITFNDETLKVDLFRAFRKEKPPNFFISEYLTPRRAELIAKLRKMKRDEHKFTSVFSLNGRIYVKTNENGPKVLVRSMNDIATLLPQDLRA